MTGKWPADRPGPWCARPDARGDDAGVGPPYANPDPPGERSIVGVGAICDLAFPTPADLRSQHFDVSEFLLWDDGNRVILHAERGLTIGAGNGAAVQPGQTAAMITADVLTTVLPEDAEQTGEDHPWEWLSQLARDRGVDVPVDRLRQLPYEVILSENVKEWLIE